ncbi:MAG: DUF896 domain-containing protein [Phascolarctobacterium sp.]|nr:DUF896 domain-containing protein [Phascolarctobacterium sp.]
MASPEFMAKVNRINELARKKKSEGLNAEEQAEQKELYKWYLGNIRAALSSQLDNIEVVDELPKNKPQS